MFIKKEIPQLFLKITQTTSISYTKRKRVPEAGGTVQKSALSSGQSILRNVQGVFVPRVSVADGRSCFESIPEILRGQSLQTFEGERAKIVLQGTAYWEPV